MERMSMRWIPALIVAVLTLTMAASAADAFDIHSIRVDVDGVTTVVEAQEDCTLLAALYNSDGKFLDLIAERPITGTDGRQTVTMDRPGTPEGSYAKVILTSPETLEPLIPGGDSRDPEMDPDGPFVPDTDVYAILYTDGELVFQHGDTPEAGREVMKTYPVDLNGYEYDEDDYRPTTPWWDDRATIQRARFADTIRPASTAYWFRGFSNLTELDLSNFDTSCVTDMGSMFSNCTDLTTLDLFHFDTSNVTNMIDMFGGCMGLTALDLSSFDTSSVTDMRSMFYGCTGLTVLDLSNFDTSNVTHMNSIFYGCRGLTALDLSHFDTSSVTDMEEMFYGCTGLTVLDLSHFDTSSVTDIRRMFSSCTGLTALDLSNFDTSNVTSMRWMFHGCTGLTALDLSNFDTSNVMDMWSMFGGCTGLTALDLSNFDTSNVTDLSSMFEGCEGLTALDLSNFDTSSVTDMSSMFFECTGLTTIEASASFVTDAGTSSSRMFTDCISLVGGAGTVYDNAHTNGEYARIDGGPSAPGYFTRKS